MCDTHQSIDISTKMAKITKNCLKMEASPETHDFSLSQHHVNIGRCEKWGVYTLLGNACKGALFSVVLDLHGVAQYGDPLRAGTAFNAYVAVPHKIRH